MNFLERLTSWLGLDQTGINNNGQLESLQTTLERARRLKRSGKYEDALTELDQALIIADRIPNVALPVAIQLQRADVLTRIGDVAQASILLDALEHDMLIDQQETQRAYIEIGRGVLAQAQSNWEDARVHFENALKQARSAHILGAEGRAEGHLADIYLTEGNASYAAHLLQEALPKLNTSGDMEMSSYFVGLLGLAMIENGKASDGQQLLGRALRLAEHMEYREYEILWRGALAVEAMKENLYEEARRHLLVVLANIGVGVRFPDHVLTLCRISKACGRLGEMEVALDYARQAVDLLTTSADRRLKLLANAALGIAHRSNGQPAEAISYLQIADDGYDDLTLSEAEYSYTELLRNIGAAQTENGAFDEAKSAYDRALDYAERHNLRLDLAGAHRDIGIFYMRQGKHQEAVQSWTTALRIYDAEDQHARVARLYCDIANVRRQFGQSKRAMKDYEQALMLLSSFDDLETRGVVLANAATAYVDHGDVTTAEAFFIEAIQIAQKTQDRALEAIRRGNYGWFLLNTGRAKSALEMLDYAVRQSENLGMSLQAAVQTDNIGLAWDALGDREQAVAYHGKAWAMLKPFDDLYWKATVAANLGDALITLGRLDDAAEVIEAALTAAREVDNSDVMTRSLNAKIRLSLASGDDDDLHTLIEESVLLAERYGGRRLIADTFILRSVLRAKDGDRSGAESDWQTAAETLRSLRLDPVQFQPKWMA